ncbi:MAG: metallophosphoesterase [Candidatus Parvarchaeota archaeon]|nr:metallophosphoesterase [Candidatus Jingweiarchaeum tengchongense]MCW1306057.1 metallophosphoesterase [Candidatus Jingweiarchaeum tengchongense]
MLGINLFAVGGIIMNVPVDFENNSEVLKFFVLSDIHSKIGNLQVALLDIKQTIEEFDLLILNGDIVDLGISEEYDKMDKFIKDNSLLTPKIIIKNIGNHEYYKDYSSGPNSLNDNDNLLLRYLKFADREKVYDDLWIRGYHFINLGSETTYNKSVDPSTDRANLSNKQILWFHEKIDENYIKGKPIFVFLHQPLDNTILFSQSHLFNINKDQEIKDICSKYPEIIFFSSHSHHTFYEEGNIYKDPSGFLCIDTSSIVEPVFYATTTAKYSIQGVYMEVHEDHALIKFRDFGRREWIKEFSIYYKK